MKEDSRFKNHPSHPGQIKGHLSGTQKKLEAAHKISGIDEESAYQLAYDAMLKASLALIFRGGIRPRSIPGHHVAIIEKAGEILGDDAANMIKVFDEMRRNRNTFLYDAEGFIGSDELKEALKIAEEYIEFVVKAVGKK